MGHLGAILELFWSPMATVLDLGLLSPCQQVKYSRAPWHLGAILEPFWDTLGGPGGPGAHLGGHLGESWAALGPTRVAFWDLIRPFKAL